MKKGNNIYTDRNHIKGLYELMYHIHNIFLENGILYYVNGGTLLGAVRHKGVIPWDDDIDLEVGYQDLPKILSQKVKDEFNKVGYLVKDNRKTLGWLKIVKKEATKARTHPDADIFPVMIKKSKRVYRTFWDFEVGRDEWPNCYFTIDELFPLKSYTFGKIEVLGPNKPDPMLTRCYGKSWKKKGYITQDADHMLLDTPILVKAGEFVAGKDFYAPRKKQIKLPRDSFFLKGQAPSFL